MHHQPYGAAIQTVAQKHTNSSTGTAKCVQRKKESPSTSPRPRTSTAHLSVAQQSSPMTSERKTRSANPSYRPAPQGRRFFLPRKLRHIVYETTVTVTIFCPIFRFSTIVLAHLIEENFLEEKKDCNKICNRYQPKYIPKLFRIKNHGHKRDQQEENETQNSEQYCSKNMSFW